MPKIDMGPIKAWNEEFKKRIKALHKAFVLRFGEPETRTFTIDCSEGRLNMFCRRGYSCPQLKIVPEKKQDAK